MTAKGRKASSRKPRRATLLPGASAARVAGTEAEGLFERVAQILDQARAAVVRSVNSQMVLAYWHIGREIVQTLQGGDDRAEYGQRLIADLSVRLTARYGRGFSTTNLRYLRTFHVVYAERTPEIRHIACGESRAKRIRHTTCGVLQDMAQAAEGQRAGLGFSPALGWSHYRALMNVNNSSERLFYEIEAEKEGWSVAHLERQVHTLLFARLLKSRDKAGVLELASEGQTIRKPADALKDPYVPDFLDLPDGGRLRESGLDAARTPPARTPTRPGPGQREPKQCQSHSRSRPPRRGSWCVPARVGRQWGMVDGQWRMVNGYRRRQMTVAETRNRTGGPTKLRSRLAALYCRSGVEMTEAETLQRAEALNRPRARSAALQSLLGIVGANVFLLSKRRCRGQRLRSRLRARLRSQEEENGGILEARGLATLPCAPREERLRSSPSATPATAKSAALLSPCLRASVVQFSFCGTGVEEFLYGVVFGMVIIFMNVGLAVQVVSPIRGISAEAQAARLLLKYREELQR